MSKKDYHEDVILNILKTLTKELIKELTRELPENNLLIEDKKQKMKKYQKEYYINNKELLKERTKNKYKSLTEDEKQKIKDYQISIEKIILQQKTKNKK